MEFKKFTERAREIFNEYKIKFITDNLLVFFITESLIIIYNDDSKIFLFSTDDGNKFIDYYKSSPTNDCEKILDELIIFKELILPKYL